MHQLLISIFLGFSHLGAVGAALSMFIENIGIPLPTEIGYLIAQHLVESNQISYWLMLLILTLGHVSGATVAYFIGRWGDSFVIHKLKSTTRLSQVNGRLKEWYNKYGEVTVFLTRFVGYVRPWSSFIAGFAEVDFWSFLFWTALGSLIFNIFNLMIAGLIMKAWYRYAQYHFLISILVIICIFGFVIYEASRRIWKKVKN